MNEIDLNLLRSWEGREKTSEDVLALAPVRALASTLDHEPEEYLDGGILPPLYHWLYFLQQTRFRDLATDGHEQKGGFMPPVPFPRRTFAGARVDYLGNLRVGERVRCVSRIKTVRYTEGRSGPIVFVTVAHRVSNTKGVQLTEEQDIAYRPAAETKTNSTAPETTAPDADFSRSICPDERLLFRFSALTLNSHRIHYDLPYARSGGYPALVVHGPLTAILLADLVAGEFSRPELQHFSFRAMSALYLGDPVKLTGKQVDKTIELTAVSHQGVAALAARAILR